MYGFKISATVNDYFIISLPVFQNRYLINIYLHVFFGVSFFSYLEYSSIMTQVGSCIARHDWPYEWADDRHLHCIYIATSTLPESKN